ncbi:MAG: MogA/MoaB family molybdenum cofactor biosynthesis protein [Chloroflexota bacterium]|nr:MogA/MoaB family molybdenum cofactor biosynthesis protein [Chloroflexota bacterium]
MSAPRPLRLGILTLSDKGAAGRRVDLSGPTVRDLLLAALPGTQVARMAVSPDDRAGIEAILRAWCDADGLGLIITTGGTGLAPRDVTPDATLAVLDYQVPGMAEAMRAAGLAHTPLAMLSRAVVGVRGRTLIINLPGSPKAVRESLPVILPVLPHALEKLAGDPADCVPTAPA